MRDLHNNIHTVRALSPVATPADNTAQVCQIIDRQGFRAVEYVIATGAIPDADATFVVLLEESDDSGMSGAVAVADVDLLGTEVLAGFQFDDDNETRKLGYIGKRRYTRMTITPAANTSATLLCVIAILGEPASAPTANPPV